MAVTLASFVPQSAKLPTSNRASLSTRNGIPILSYPNGTDNAAIFLGVMPATASLSSSLSVLIRWTTTATTGNAVLGASIERDDSGTDLDSDSFDTEATVTTAAPGTSGAPATSTITFAAPADFDSVLAGEQYRLKIRVLGANGSHTVGAAVQVMSVMVQEPGSTGGGGASSARVGARAYRTTNQTISNDVTTTITLDSEDFDTDGFHSTSANTERLTIPSGKDGLYLVSARVIWASNATGHRSVYVVRKNSGGTVQEYHPEFLQTVSDAGQPCIMGLTVFSAASAGDWFEMQVTQKSGGNLNITPSAAPSHLYVSLGCIRIQD